MPMANTAEKLAAQFGITRAQCDEFALRSQVFVEYLLVLL
jgi:acetyl-CoA acetyltransferase